MRKRLKIKNLIKNNSQRNIFLNGRRSLLLYIGHKLSCNGARYIPSPPGEKVRMRGHKGIVESRQHRYAFLSKGEGGHSPLLHMGSRLRKTEPEGILGGGQLCASQQYLYVMLNLFQHLATDENHGYSKRLPQRRNIGQTLNQVQGDMKMLDCTPAKVQRRPLYIPSPLGGKVAGGRMRGQSGTLKNSKAPSPLPHLSQKQSTGMFLFGRVQGERGEILVPRGEE